MVIKNYLFAMIAIIMAAALVSATGVLDKKTDREFATMYFEYQGTAEDVTSLANPNNWSMILDPSESACPQKGEVICVTKKDNLPVYGFPYTTPEERFAHFLELEPDGGVGYIATPTNRLKEKTN